MILAVSVMALSLATAGLEGQEATETLTPAAPAAGASEWHVVSRSATTAYMIDVNGIRQQGGVTTALLARVPATGSASDRAHSVTHMSFQCAANQSKSGEEIYYAPDGSEEERIPNDYDFEAIPANSLDDHAKAFVCNGDRSSRSYQTIADFIAAGRPTRN